MHKKLQVNRFIYAAQFFVKKLVVMAESSALLDCIFFGIQSIGIPHLGNYLGALESWVNLQDRHSSVLYSIVDLHSITVRALLSPATKVQSLRNPTAKMSKSDPEHLATMLLTGSPEDATLKFFEAVTDFTSEVTFDPKAWPSLSNLMAIHAAVLGGTVEQALVQYKQPVADAILRLRCEPGYLRFVLDNRSRRARELAILVLSRVC
uniref:Tryptophanyl-tRNA synthetase n=1 Tax=Scleropages formosus TaxID=113540 RepID=A0A8C9R7B9_SCLFO